MRFKDIPFGIVLLMIFFVVSLISISSGFAFPVLVNQTFVVDPVNGLCNSTILIGGQSIITDCSGNSSIVALFDDGFNSSSSSFNNVNITNNNGLTNILTNNFNVTFNDTFTSFFSNQINFTNSNVNNNVIANNFNLSWNNNVTQFNSNVLNLNITPVTLLNFSYNPYFNQTISLSCPTIPQPICQAPIVNVFLNNTIDWPQGATPAQPIVAPPVNPQVQPSAPTIPSTPSSGFPIQSMILWVSVIGLGLLAYFKWIKPRFNKSQDEVQGEIQVTQYPSRPSLYVPKKDDNDMSSGISKKFDDEFARLDEMSKR